QVNQAATATTITSDNPFLPAVDGICALIVTGVLTCARPSTPTGTVTVGDGDGNTCTAAVGAGSCNLTSTSAGPKTLTATYSGDEIGRASGRDRAQQAEQAATTKTNTSDNPDPPVAGESYPVT